MDLIELHILQSFPATCLNRDDVGAPKTAVFGGVQRARVSSQSWKRAIRFMARELQPAFFAGTRTRFVLRELTRLFQEHGVGEEVAQELAIAAADALGKVDKIEKGNVKTLLFFSPQELQNVVEETLKVDYAEAVENILGAQDDKKRSKARGKLVKLVERASKKLKAPVRDAADIAVFGRMVADDHTMMVEGAGMFSHALSTHQASNEVEFFSAVDDAAEPGDEGAGHIGTLEYTSACYYRYVGLNLDLLRDEKHLAHFSGDEFRSVLDAFLRAALLAVPQARKNSMFGHTLPSFVLGLRRRGHPLSLVNAFEKPVPSRRAGYLEASKEALVQHFEALGRTYGITPRVEARIPDLPLDAFVTALMADTPDGEA